MLNNRGLGRGHKETLKYHHDTKGNCLLRKLQQKTLSAVAVYKSTGLLAALFLSSQAFHQFDTI